MRYAIVGGNNIDTLPIPYREEAVSTPYGDVVLFRARLDGETGPEIIFRYRHGVLSQSDPGQINYRANVYALHKIGVTHVIGVTSVGACDYSYKLGTLCLLNDFIDFTKSRPTSFNREHRKGLHTGMEDVFDSALNDRIECLVDEMRIPYSGRAIYACTEGPRFETAAEIRMLRAMGAQVTGMTVVPEAPLCREIGLTYASIGIIANRCTGMQSYVTDEGIGEVMAGIRQSVFDLLFELVRRSEKQEDA